MQQRKISLLPVNEIRPFLDRERPRAPFVELVESVKNHGVLVPITVTAMMRKKTKRQNKKTAGKGKLWFYELVKGHGRLRAAKDAGLLSIPSYIVPMDDAGRVK